MTITKRWLNGKDACASGVDWWAENKISNPVKCVKALMGEEKHEWANWLICRVFTRKQAIRYAVFAAEQVIDKFEKIYPDDKRPREAIEAAKDCIKNRSKKNIERAKIAYAYAYAAASASACACAYASAYAYASACACAAASASASAHSKEMRIKILNYGLSLLGGKP